VINVKAISRVAYRETLVVVYRHVDMSG
jgi:hypothetical protein